MLEKFNSIMKMQAEFFKSFQDRLGQDASYKKGIKRMMLPILVMMMN